MNKAQQTNSTLFFNTKTCFVKFASPPFFTLNTARKYNYVYTVLHFTLRS